MKIRKLQLKNIGPFDDETIEFQECPEDKAEIHIFTGENGTGKTTLLTALISAFNNKTLLNNFEKRSKNPNNEYSSIRVTLKEKEALPRVRVFKSYKDKFPILDFGGLENEEWLNITESNFQTIKLKFSAFAYSSYRRIEDEKINLFEEVEENPLNQALDFVKDEKSKFTINQWLGQNLSKRALAKEEKNKEEKFI